jgi:hypothetical protein
VVDNANKTVTFDVSGIRYPILVKDAEKYPESFFARAIKNEQHLQDSAIKVQRDGQLFRYISAFLVLGALPRTQGKLDLSQEAIEALKKEADFFNLSALGAECSIVELKDDAKLDAYRTIRTYVESAKDLPDCKDIIECEYPTGEHDPTGLMTQLAKLFTPFCVKGKMKFELHGYYVKSDAPLFKSSTISSFNIPELVESAKESAFGTGTETLIDPTVRRSWEIPAAELYSPTLQALKRRLSCDSLAPNLRLELRPYKLVVYQEGGHFDAHRDTVRGDGHIGTLVLVLNSTYTGGELEVTHNGQTEVMTGGPYSCVAMYGDCLHKINPVTSGTRVSLIFDIYGDEWEQGKESDIYFWEASKCEAQKITCAEAPINRSAILEGIDKELDDECDTLVICLVHKYPLHQTMPEFLKGADRALYELLKDEYDVEVGEYTVHHQEYHYDRPEDRVVYATKFTSFTNPPVYAESPAAAETATRTKFLIPSPIDAAAVLDNSVLTPSPVDAVMVQDYSTNNADILREIQTECTLYLVAGLQVRRRLKVSTRL